MEKHKRNIEIRAYKRTKDIEIIEVSPPGERNEVIQKINFDDSQEFCKFFLKLARDMGISRFDFAAGCNAVADEIEGWDNL